MSYLVNSRVSEFLIVADSMLIMVCDLIDFYQNGKFAIL